MMTTNCGKHYINNALFMRIKISPEFKTFIIQNSFSGQGAENGHTE